MKTSNVFLPQKNAKRIALTQEQFATKVSLEKDNIKNYLGKMFDDSSTEVESLATNALKRALKKYNKYDGIDSIDTWLYGIVNNVVIDHIKSKRKVA